LRAKRGFCSCGRCGARIDHGNKSHRSKTATSLSAERLQWLEASGICHDAHCARRCGREAEGGGLLNRYRVVKLYRGFESLRLRQPSHINQLLNADCVDRSTKYSPHVAQPKHCRSQCGRLSSQCSKRHSRPFAWAMLLPRLTLHSRLKHPCLAMSRAIEKGSELVEDCFPVAPWPARSRD
jgi:hypothetical protein